MKRHIEKLTEPAAVIFALLYIYTGFIKLLDTNRFYSGLTQSPLIPQSLTGIVVYTVPIAELIIAVLLLYPRSRKAGFYLFFLSMFAFTLYVAVILFYTRHVPCTCGGIIEQMGWNAHLVFNSVCTLLALLCILPCKKGGSNLPTGISAA